MEGPLKCEDISGIGSYGTTHAKLCEAVFQNEPKKALAPPSARQQKLLFCTPITALPLLEQCQQLIDVLDSWLGVPHTPKHDFEPPPLNSKPLRRNRSHNLGRKFLRTTRNSRYPKLE